MDLKLLRDATRAEHEATESSVPLTGAGLTRQQYVTVLRGFSALVCAWDAVAEADAPEDLTELVRERRRCGSLLADLQFFGEGAGEQPVAVLLAKMRSLFQDGDRATRRSRFLGAMYVLEGSTLGGQYIAAHVEKELGLSRGEGDAFFRGYGAETMPKWRAFQQVLLAIPDDDSDAVIQAAKGMFGIFGEWLESGVTPAIQGTEAGAAL